MPKPISFAVAGLAAMVALGALPATAQDIESKAQLCATCHGQNGAPQIPVMPIIWGQQPSYLYKELHDYHSGERDNPVMVPLVKGVTLGDLRKLADAFAAKPWPAKTGAATAAASPDGMTNCRACHGDNYQGAASGPRLAGQSYEYLLAAMNAFASGERDNNGDMPGFMKALSGSQRDAIAHYLAGL